MKCFKTLVPTARYYDLLIKKQIFFENQCLNIQWFFKSINKNIKFCTYWAVSLVVHGKKNEKQVKKRKKETTVFTSEFEMYFSTLTICLSPS